ncbi:MAG TPA: trypsin-like serine protease [Acidimicrobiia bacterium]
MRRRLGMAMAALALAALALPAAAITNGQPDGNDHPYVGLAVFDVQTPNGPVPSHRCSASLLTPTVVLTAGHCTDGTVQARIWFDEDVQSNAEYPFSGATSYDGTPYTNPDFAIGAGNGLPGFALRDVGVIVLSEPVPMSAVSEYASLPSAGLVDTLKNKTGVDIVGYGVQEQIVGNGPPVWAGLRVRLQAESRFVSGNFVHADEFVRLSQNPGGGTGGTCFGDSGGPDLLGGTDTVLAVNSYVTNGNCAGVGYGSRVDIPEVLDWIQAFIP